MYMTSIKVKFHPSSIIQKEGTLHDQIIHHREVRKLRTGYRLFPNEWNTKAVFTTSYYSIICK